MSAQAESFTAQGNTIPKNSINQSKTAVKRQLQEAIQKRQENYAEISTLRAKCERSGRQLRKVLDLAESLKVDVDLSTPIAQELNEMMLTEASKLFVDTEKALANLQNRCKRLTINLGVCGYAKAGKSTFLCTVSGLDERTIPAGELCPTTAVRSKIVCRKGAPSASINYLSSEEFLSVRIQPHHKSLGLPGPFSMEEFASMDYDALPLADAAHRSASTQADLNKLKEMQASLASYKNLLDSEGSYITDLAEIRPYIAYPSASERGNKTQHEIERPYLAVKDVHIYREFQHDCASSLALVDAPGLGEYGSSPAQILHSSLEEEADSIILLIRATKEQAYIGKKDIELAGFLESIQPQVTNRRDFITIVINYEESEPETAEALLHDVEDMLNGRGDRQRYRICKADVSSAESVYANVMEPLVQHLGNTLKATDQALFADAEKLIERAEAATHQILRKLKGVIEKMLVTLPADRRTLRRLSRALKGDVNRKLAALATKRYVRTFSDNEYQENVDAYTFVDQLTDEIASEIEAGTFWHGNWDQEAINQVVHDRTGEGFLLDELNRARVNISAKYETMNVQYEKRMDSFLGEVTEIMQENTGGLLTNCTGRDCVQKLLDLLAQSGEHYPAFQAALEWLLSLQYDFRQHVYPGIRQALTIIDPLGKQHAGRLRDLEGYTIDALPERIKNILQRDVQAANSAVNEAIKDNINNIESFLFAGLEHFTDQFMRSEDSDDDFEAFAERFKEHLWQDIFAAKDQRREHLERSLGIIRQTLESI